MKKLIIVILLSFPIISFAQSKLTIDISAGSSFKTLLTTVGGGVGLRSSTGLHTLMLTVETDQIYNSELLKYGRPDRIKPLEDGSTFSTVLGLEYALKLASFNKYSVSSVVQPWTSLNLNLSSANVGLRTTFTSKTDAVALEFVYDPKYSRGQLKFVFFTSKKNKK